MEAGSELDTMAPSSEAILKDKEGPRQPFDGTSKKVAKPKRRGVFIANPVGCKGIRNEPKEVKDPSVSKQERKRADKRHEEKLRCIGGIFESLKPAIRRKNRKAK